MNSRSESLLHISSSFLTHQNQLQTNFLAVSPAYLTMRPINYASIDGAFTGNPALATTQTVDVVGNATAFYTVRQNNTATFDTQTYTISVPTSVGNLTIPTLGGSLTLSGRDSKIHVVDYQAGNATLLYSSAEIFTWWVTLQFDKHTSSSTVVFRATIDDRDIIVVYGNDGELHETAFVFENDNLPEANVVDGPGEIQTGAVANSSLAIQYTTSGQTVVEIGSNILLYILGEWLFPPCVLDGSFFD